MSFSALSPSSCSTAPQEDVDLDALLKRPPVVIPVAYNTRDLLLYALGIGSTDRRFVYELDPNFLAFPTYPICLTYKADSFDTLPYPPPAIQAVDVPLLKGCKVGLDAEKVIEKVAELPTVATKMNLVGRVVGVHKKGSGALVESAYELQDESGKVYYKIISGFFQVGVTDFKDVGVSYSENLPVPKSAPTYTEEVVIGKHAPSLFRLSGDYNPLHVDPTVSQAGGFDVPILHGLCTLGNTTRVVLEKVAGGDAKRYRSVRMRFQSPVTPGQTLVVRIWTTSPTEVLFQTLIKETGKTCISHGKMVLNPQAHL